MLKCTVPENEGSKQVIEQERNRLVGYLTITLFIIKPRHKPIHKLIDRNEL